jgi:hypothetical protein
MMRGCHVAIMARFEKANAEPQLRFFGSCQQIGRAVAVAVVTTVRERKPLVAYEIDPVAVNPAVRLAASSES